MSFEIGKIQSEVGRDAIHVPVISAYCSDAIKAGDPVCFYDDSFQQVRIAGKDEKSHGIVDPFLDWKKRRPCVQILVFLRPGTVSKLTHHFEPVIENLPIAYVPSVDEYDDEDDDNSCRGCY